MNRLRKGMWITYGGHVGILVRFETIPGDPENAIPPAPGAIIHLTDEKGETVAQVHAPVSSISQAAFDDIPLPRRPDEAVAIDFGYLHPTIDPT